LRDILVACTQQDFAVTGVEVERESSETSRDRRRKQARKPRAREAAYAVAPGLEEADDSPNAAKPIVAVALELRGGRSLARLVQKLSEIDGVFAVNAGDDAGLASD
jgi:hypothetical protein